MRLGECQGGKVAYYLMPRSTMVTLSPVSPPPPSGGGEEVGIC